MLVRQVHGHVSKQDGVVLRYQVFLRNMVQWSCRILVVDVVCWMICGTCYLMTIVKLIWSTLQGDIVKYICIWYTWCLNLKLSMIF